MSLEKKYYLVNSVDTVELLLQHIEECDHLAIDTETTGLNVRKDKIVGWSISGEEGVGFYVPTFVWNPQKQELEEQFIGGRSAHDLTKKIFKKLKGRKLVAHNFSFDGRIIKNYYGVDLIDSIWVDTGMLVHTLNEEGAFGYGNPFGLKSIAIMHQEELGLNVEMAANQEQLDLKESIKANGGEITQGNFEIYKADLKCLYEYGAADTDLTLRICNLYLKKLKEEGLEQFFFEDEVMPIYREVTIPMEEYGVDLDMELLQKTRKDIERDLTENKKVVISSLMSTQQGKQWALDTAMEKFPPKNKGGWASRLIDRYSLPFPRSEKTGKYSISKQTIKDVKYQCTEERLQPIIKFLEEGDTKLLDETEVIRITLDLWKESNDGEYINIQSKKHLQEVVFKYFGEKALTQTEKGQDQFDMDMIEELSKKYEWAENLRVYNKLLKIKSTYVDRFLDNQENGRYYPYYKQFGTVSGRYGSDMQQLPKPKEDGEDVPLIVYYTNLVRAFFIAGKGRKFIDSDYESLEPHCFASVSGDENLREIFRKGWDFYSTVAIKTEKLDQDKTRYPEGVSPDKKAPNYLKKLDAPKRNKAKSYSLGVAYGMSAFALKETLQISQKEAQVLIDGYLDGFPGLRSWMENSRKQVNEHGFIKNYVGRVRHLPIAKAIYEKFGDNFMDWNYRKQLETRYGADMVLKLYRDYKNAMNNVLNFQLQSLAASVVNRAALQINRKAKELGIDAQVIAQIHDQLVINVSEEDAEMFAPIVQGIMEHNLELPGITLKAPPEIANNLKEGH